jgi:hypothetical protein
MNHHAGFFVFMSGEKWIRSIPVKVFEKGWGSGGREKLLSRSFSLPPEFTQ